MTGTDSEKKGLPAWLGYMILFTRVTVTGGSSIAVLLAGHHLLNVPAYLLPATLTLGPNTEYIAVVVVTTVVVTGIMFYPAMAISWGVAWLLSPRIRREVQEFNRENASGKSE